MKITNQTIKERATPAFLQPLVQEAWKYKSAEEFVKQADFYWQDRRAMGGGESYTEVTIHGKFAGAIIDSEAMPVPETATALERLSVEQGKFGVVDANGNPLGVFDTEVEAEKALKQQLTDFYNQAVRGTTM